MFTRVRSTLLIPMAGLVVLNCCGLLAQPSSALSPRALITKAVAAGGDKVSRTRYTYFELAHLQNRYLKGRPIFRIGNLFLDTTTLYEYTWIGDLPYKRVVEFQGKPLTGDALAKEQARYDKAVAEHSGLGGDARAKILHQRLVSSNIHLADLLTPAYTLVELRQETVAGNLTHVIDCAPIPSNDPLHPTATKHYQLWVTDSGAILRNMFDVIADETEMLRGSHGQLDSQLIDGNLLPLHELVHFNSPIVQKGSIITVDVDNSYTNFRRFTATTRILAAGDQPEKSPADTPQ